MGVQVLNASCPSEQRQGRRLQEEDGIIRCLRLERLLVGPLIEATLCVSTFTDLTPVEEGSLGEIGDPAPNLA